MREGNVSRRHLLKSAGLAGATSIAGAASLATLGPTALVAKAADRSDDNAIVGAWRGTAEVSGLGSFATLLSFAAGGTLVH